MKKKKYQMFDYNIFDHINTGIMCLIAVTMLYPFLYTLFVSISDSYSIASGAVKFYPSGLNLAAYQMVFKNDDILVAYYNSIRYAFFGTIVFVFITSIVAYPLTIRGFWLNKGASMLYVFTMFLSGGMIPTYLVYKTLGLVNTMWVMVLPSALGVFNIMIFRTYFLGIGSELREAAYIDGAHDLYVLFRIYMPLSKPIIATFSLFQIVGIWNNFFTPLLFLHDERLQPLTILLRRLLIEMDIQTFRVQMEHSIIERERREVVPVQGFKSASIIVSILPIICIYPFIQKYFVKGIMIGSLKQ